MIQYFYSGLCWVTHKSFSWLWTPNVSSFNLWGLTQSWKYAFIHFNVGEYIVSLVHLEHEEMRFAQAEAAP